MHENGDCFTYPQFPPSSATTGWSAMCVILASGHAARRPPPRKAKNLPDAPMACAEQVLALSYDLHVPLANTQTERDMRLISRAANDFWHFLSATGSPLRKDIFPN